ncbi:hypothetical protein [Ferrimicrobium sp.]|uniref:hypothetical protein n=1 Tax=Ferrimicrobium sp. TaxID=2926050 RepID=UPI00261F9254|nr:hypothetical protein [Ferrimicrobium sp.]
METTNSDDLARAEVILKNLALFDFIQYIDNRCEHYPADATDITSAATVSIIDDFLTSKSWSISNHQDAQEYGILPFLQMKTTPPFLFPMMSLLHQQIKREQTKQDQVKDDNDRDENDRVLRDEDITELNKLWNVVSSSSDTPSARNSPGSDPAPRKTVALAIQIIRNSLAHFLEGVETTDIRDRIGGQSPNGGRSHTETTFIDFDKRAFFSRQGSVSFTEDNFAAFFSVSRSITMRICLQIVKPDKASAQQLL